ncbi:hypothetical protein Tco_1057535 [Tanacetum coccineum]|uniref:Uncharacterized protein n=1 Tax=Tanacetum coccineum TaxID=301880 RepID=A0ABQ5H5M6_9ASTR
MEILPVSTSNNIAVGDLRDPIWIKLVSIGYGFGPVYELTTHSYGESITYVLEDPILQAGNPVKEVLTNCTYLITSRSSRNRRLFYGGGSLLQLTSYGKISNGKLLLMGQSGGEVPCQKRHQTDIFPKVSASFVVIEEDWSRIDDELLFGPV